MRNKIFGTSEAVWILDLGPEARDGGGQIYHPRARINRQVHGYRRNRIFPFHAYFKLFLS